MKLSGVLLFVLLALSSSAQPDMVKDWMSENFPQLNPEKKEELIIDTEHLGNQAQTLLGRLIPNLKETAKNLGATSNIVNFNPDLEDKIPDLDDDESTLAPLTAAELEKVTADPEDKEEEVVNKNPDLEDKIPEITENGSTLAPLTAAELVKNRKRRSASTLTWETSQGSVPSGAVYIDNSYTNRRDYVCQYRCSAGFFNPQLGPHCRYAYGDKELLGSPFEILVNKDNVENLEWKIDSNGGVPDNSVETCPGSGTYVGKNKYGLGKVVVKHQAFFLPWEGKEYWYKLYQVLTVN